jgi:integrase
VLWPETIAALEKIERLPEVDCIFRAYTGKRLGVKGAEKRFRGIRDAAELPGVTSSQLRDGAMTAAVEAGTNSQHIAILMGQRSGIADHYLKRNPKMIAGACLAIRKHYFEPAPEIAGEIKAA